MAAHHHYVSKFHLKQFTDPNSLTSRDPWLWQGFVPKGPVKRRAPKNVGTANLMFEGPGGLADRNATLESFLARKVEGPAANAMKEVCEWKSGVGRELPPPLTRYLAWAAARSLPMQTLEHFWAEKEFGRGGEVVEPPPEGLLKASESQPDVQMVHPRLGRRVFPVGSDFERAVTEGWFPDMRDRVNFLEGVHIQAYYFQERFFPRFKWFTLRPPEGEFFVIGDRAVGWAADGYIDAPPQLFARSVGVRARTDLSGSFACW